MRSAFAHKRALRLPSPWRIAALCEELTRECRPTETSEVNRLTAIRITRALSPSTPAETVGAGGSYSAVTDAPKAPTRETSIRQLGFNY